MKVTDESRFHSGYHGKQYYFCSDACLTKFQAAPEQYVEPPAVDAAPPAPEGALYTCPMHPEIRQDHPGQCPKCGMTLEPVLPDVDEGENPELVDFRRRFWWTLPLTAMVFVLAMFGHGLECHEMVCGAGAPPRPNPGRRDGERVGRLLRDRLRYVGAEPVHGDLFQRAVLLHRAQGIVDRLLKLRIPLAERNAHFLLSTL